MIQILQLLQMLQMLETLQMLWILWMFQTLPRNIFVQNLHFILFFLWDIEMWFSIFPEKNIKRRVGDVINDNFISQLMWSNSSRLQVLNHSTIIFSFMTLCYLSVHVISLSLSDKTIYDLEELKMNFERRVYQKLGKSNGLIQWFSTSFSMGNPFGPKIFLRNP